MEAHAKTRTEVQQGPLFLAHGTILGAVMMLHRWTSTNTSLEKEWS